MSLYASKWSIIIDFEEAESYRGNSNAQIVEEVIAEAGKDSYVKEHLYEITNMWIGHHEAPYESYQYDEPVHFNNSLNDIVWRYESITKMKSKDKELFTLAINDEGEVK